MQANFLQRWNLAAESALAVLLCEEGSYENCGGYDRAVFEYGLQAYHMPPGQHRAVFQAIRDLRDDRKPVHPSTVATHCNEHVKPDWVYGLAATYDMTLDSDVFNTNVRTLLEMGETARVKDTLAQAATSLESGTKRDDVVLRVMNDLATSGGDTISNETAGAGGTLLEDLLSRSPDKLMKTGIAPLDGWMGGIGEDDVIGIVAPYKMRKSTLKRNVVLNIVENGGSGSICMYESNRVMVISQFVSMLAVRWLYKQGQYDATDAQGRPVRWISGKDLVRVGNGYKRWHPLKAEAVNEGIKAYKAIGDRLRIYDKSKDGGALSSLSSLQRVLMRDKNRYGTDIAAIDHLLLIDEPGTDYEVMSKSARFLETFARREKVSLLLLAQMNEASIKENGQGHSPGVKGGGDLAAAVDYMFTVSYKESEDGNKNSDVMTVTMRLSRYGDGGAHVKSDLRIDPNSGYVFGVAA